MRASADTALIPSRARAYLDPHGFARRYNAPLVNRILYLSRAEVEHLLDVDALLEALAGALAAFSGGKASAPPRIGARIPDRGVLGAMVGYLPGAGLEAKLVSVFPRNGRRGRPSHQGLIALFDEEDGTPLALMDGTAPTPGRALLPHRGPATPAAQGPCPPHPNPGTAASRRPAVTRGRNVKRRRSAVRCKSRGLDHLADGVDHDARPLPLDVVPAPMGDHACPHRGEP